MRGRENQGVPGWVNAVAMREAVQLYELAPTQFRERAATVERLRIGIEELLMKEISARAA